MLHPPIPWKVVLTCSLLAVAASAVQAQETQGIQWRTSYAAARKEAEAKKLPMLIDLTTDPCPYCIKMDRETFSDARVANLINQRFIPLKINYREDPSLAVALKIGLFPAIVTASADGNILKTKIGFQPADDLHELMQQTLSKITPPDGTRDKYLAAVKLEAAGEYVRAMSHLRDILDDVNPRPIKADAEKLLKQIEKRAEDRLSRAKELKDKGQSSEALEVCTEVMRLFPGVPASRSAQELIREVAMAKPEAPLQNRNKKARDYLVQAKGFYENKEYLPCWYFCNKILENYGDLPEGREAHVLTSKIKNNKEWLQNAAAEMADGLGGFYLSLADNCLKQGEVRQAQQYLQQVITNFPGSRVAESAQVRLNQLQGTVPAQSIARPGGPS